MLENKVKISACLVVYNEEAIISRCLESIREVADEIIIVHDGPCKDKTLEIAAKYTDKIYIRKHIGIAEPHRSFTYTEAKGQWILQLDADEFIDTQDVNKIKDLVESTNNDAYIFKWELWNGKKPIYFDGLQKMCLFRKEKFYFHGLPQEIGFSKGTVVKVDLFLHHRPIYSNVSWKEFFRKTKKWTDIQAKYYFPELVEYNCFNDSAEVWINETRKIRSKRLYYQFFEPIKMALGQLKNGLWKNKYGWIVVGQRYVYFCMLYWKVFKIQKDLN